MRLLGLLLCIFLVSCSRQETAPHQTAGSSYYQCKFLMHKPDVAKKESGQASEVCNQLHPAREATTEERLAVDVYISDTRIDGYRNLEIHNKNSTFIVTEIVMTFEDQKRKSNIRFEVEAKPLSLAWTELEAIGIENPTNASVTTIKGRAYQ